MEETWAKKQFKMIDLCAENALITTSKSRGIWSCCLVIFACNLSKALDVLTPQAVEVTRKYVDHFQPPPKRLPPANFTFTSDVKIMIIPRMFLEFQSYKLLISPDPLGKITAMPD